VREEHLRYALGGIGLTDARTGLAVDLGRLPGVQVLSLIRHRY
jgi:hypothetical protein